MKTPEDAADNKVSKTPDEIKKGLSLHRSTLSCDNICPYDGWNAETGSCIQRLMKDTVEYIEHLESRLAQVERERDAAVRAITDAQHYIKNLGAVQYGLQQLEKWDYYIKQRGVCPENTKEEK